MRQAPLNKRQLRKMLEHLPLTLTISREINATTSEKICSRLSSDLKSVCDVTQNRISKKLSSEKKDKDIAVKKKR